MSRQGCSHLYPYQTLNCVLKYYQFINKDNSNIPIFTLKIPCTKCKNPRFKLSTSSSSSSPFAEDSTRAWDYTGH